MCMALCVFVHIYLYLILTIYKYDCILDVNILFFEGFF